MGIPYTESESGLFLDAGSGLKLDWVPSPSVASITVHFSRSIWTRGHLSLLNEGVIVIERWSRTPGEMKKNTETGPGGPFRKDYTDGFTDRIIGPSIPQTTPQ
jgi:hypothetical protein